MLSRLLLLSADGAAASSSSTASRQVACGRRILRRTRWEFRSALSMTSLSREVIGARRPRRPEGHQWNRARRLMTPPSGFAQTSPRGGWSSSFSALVDRASSDYRDDDDAESSLPTTKDELLSRIKSDLLDDVERVLSLSDGVSESSSSTERRGGSGRRGRRPPPPLRKRMGWQLRRVRRRHGRGAGGIGDDGSGGEFSAMMDQDLDVAIGGGGEFSSVLNEVVGATEADGTSDSEGADRRSGGADDLDFVSSESDSRSSGLFSSVIDNSAGDSFDYASTSSNDVGSGSPLIETPAAAFAAVSDDAVQGDDATTRHPPEAASLDPEEDELESVVRGGTRASQQKSSRDARPSLGVSLADFYDSKPDASVAEDGAGSSDGGPDGTSAAAAESEASTTAATPSSVPATGAGAGGAKSLLEALDDYESSLTRGGRPGETSAPAAPESKEYEFAYGPSASPGTFRDITDARTAAEAGNGAEGGGDGSSLMDLLNENYLDEKKEEEAAAPPPPPRPPSQSTGGREDGTTFASLADPAATTMEGEGRSSRGSDSGSFMDLMNADSDFSSRGDEPRETEDGRSADGERGTKRGSLLDLLDEYDNDDDAGVGSGGRAPPGSSSPGAGSDGGGIGGSFLSMIDEQVAEDGGGDNTTSDDNAGGGFPFDGNPEADRPSSFLSMADSGDGSVSDGIGGSGSGGTDNDGSFLSMIGGAVTGEDDNGFGGFRDGSDDEDALSMTMEGVVDRVLSLRGAMDDGEEERYHRRGGTAAGAAEAVLADMLRLGDDGPSEGGHPGIRANDDDSRSSEREEASAFALAEALLEGWSEREDTAVDEGEGNGEVRWTLTTDEANALLLHVATSLPPDERSVRLLLNVYDRMKGGLKKKRRNKRGRQRTGGDAAPTQTPPMVCAPDAATYATVISALDRWGSSPAAAARVCSEMLARRRVEGDGDDGGEMSFELDERAVDAAMRVLCRRGAAEEAEELLEWALEGFVGGVDGLGVDDADDLLGAGAEEVATAGGRSPRIRTEAFGFLLGMYKKNHDQEKAVSLMKRVVEVKGRTDPKGANRLLLNLVRWPHGGPPFPFETVVNYLESSAAAGDNGDASSFRPSYAVWKTLAAQTSRSARRNPTANWGLVRRIFRNLVRQNSSSNGLGGESTFRRRSPDRAAFGIGMDAAAATADAQLAVDLLEWASEEQCASRDHRDSIKFWGDNDGVGSEAKMNDAHSHVGATNGEGGQLEAAVTDGDKADDFGDIWAAPKMVRGDKSAGVSAQAYLRVITLCLEQGELDLARRVLDGSLRSSPDRIPDAARSHLHTLVVIAYAKTGNVETARHLLTTMQTEGPGPCPNTYAALIHALAVQRKRDAATAILESMLSDEFGDGIKPTQSAYNACMLSAMQDGDWEGVLSLHKQMQGAGLPLDQVSFHGVILASGRVGNKDYGTNAVRSAVELNLPFSKEMFLLCTQALAPCVQDATRSTEVLSKKLKELATTRQDIAGKVLDLDKAVRDAEIVEMNAPLRGGEETRAKSWRLAVERLLDMNVDLD